MTAMIDLLDRITSDEAKKKKEINNLIDRQFVRIREHINKYRKSNGFTVNQMAEILNMKPSIAERILVKSQKPTAEDMLKVIYHTGFRLEGLDHED